MSELTKPGVWTAAAVRQEFIEFFEKKFGHTIIPSSPVIAPPEDTTLLFNNAGMNQFKDIFLGLVGNNHKFHGLKRAVDTQKCIRAGGKHNDLDDVGKDGYHHTFFEMLGNWSFGDYFKVEAIVMAWQLLTVVFKLDPNRLYVTYFMGDKKAGLEPDLDAKELWKKVGVADDHIIEGNMKDNFWEMGEVGPCGPCSEIHYDRIGGRNAAALVNQDDPNVLEIWNIVFMTYNREANGQLPKLPNQHIDTGMGFERLVSILQDKQSNYDTDVFWPLFNKIEEVVGCRKYTDKYGADDTDGLDTAYRICADHLRTASFSIADGCIPDKDDAGYVLRRVIRRGARFANKSFGAKLGVNKETGERDVFFSKLLPALVAQMGDQFPELREKENHIKDVLDEEELAFATTLVKGEVRFKKLAAEAEKNGSGKISGADAFKLYDTFGYPPDLTKIMAEEIGLTIDDDEVKAAEAKHIEASKSNKKATQDWQKPGPVEIGQLKADHSQTESDAKFSSDDITAKVQTIYDDKAKQFLSTTKGLPRDKTIGIVLDKTNFYAEQGGQVADAGKLYTESGIDFTVSDVQIYGGYVIHIGILTDGELSTGDEVICHYDQERRNPIMNNHTGTHVLNHSLRKHLGNDIVQKGSLVDTDKLRFDFSHPSQISIAKIKEIEDSSNEYLTKNLKVFAKDVPLELAKGIFGVRAVFGEQYPDPVRVVSVGVDVDTLLKEPTKEEWFNYSIEFCGGTHVVETGIIRQMIIVEESGIAKGVRRLTVYTGTKAATTQRVATEFGNQIKALEALEFGPAKDQELKRMQNALNGLTISTIVKNEFQDKIAVISKSILAAQKAKQKKDTAAAIAYLTEIVEKPENKDSQYFVARLPIGDDSKIVGDVLNNFKKSQKEKSVYVFASGAGATGVAHGVYIGTGHGSKLTAVEAADKVSSSVGGKSGSKDPTIRTGRGNDLSKVDEAVASITKLFEEKLKL